MGAPPQLHAAGEHSPHPCPFIHLVLPETLPPGRSSRGRHSATAPGGRLAGSGSIQQTCLQQQGHGKQAGLRAGRQFCRQAGRQAAFFQASGLGGAQHKLAQVRRSHAGAAQAHASLNGSPAHRRACAPPPHAQSRSCEDASEGNRADVTAGGGSAAAAAAGSGGGASKAETICHRRDRRLVPTLQRCGERWAALRAGPPPSRLAPPRCSHPAGLGRCRHRRQRASRLAARRGEHRRALAASRPIGRLPPPWTLLLLDHSSKSNSDRIHVASRMLRRPLMNPRRPEALDPLQQQCARSASPILTGAQCSPHWGARP